VIDLIKQIANLQKQVDGLIKPEVPLGLSLISESVFVASATSIAFSSLPQGFRHLMLIVQARTDVAAENDAVLVQFNGAVGASYDWQRLTGNSATVSSLATRAATSIQFGLCEGANSRASNFSPTLGYVFGYALSTAEKWTLSACAAFGDVSADTDLFVQLRAGRFRDTTVIQQVAFLPLTGPNFISGSRFQIYGIY